MCNWVKKGLDCLKREAGLRQGCSLSPVLYSVYVMEMLKDLEKKRLGIEVEETWCGWLLYAADIVLLAKDQVELQVMLDVMEKYVMKWEFRFNSKKTKTMMVGRKCSGGELNINEERIENVEVFKYLGV